MTAIFVTADDPTPTVLWARDPPRPARRRALPLRGPRPRPRLGAAGGRGTRVGRRLADAAARPRDVGAVPTFCRSRSATRGRPPDLARVASTIGTVRGLFEEHWPSSADVWMPDGRVPAAGDVLRQGVRRHAATGSSTARRRPPPARIGSTPRGTSGATASWRKRSRVRRRRPPALLGHRPRRRDDRRGPGGVLRDLRAGHHPRLPRHDRRQDRPVGAGTRAAAGAVDPRRLRAARGRPVHRRRCTPGAGGTEAGARRPGRATTATPTRPRTCWRRSTCCSPTTTPRPGVR